MFGVFVSVCRSELIVISCYTEKQTLTKRKVALSLNTTCRRIVVKDRYTFTHSRR
jgi:hypothetical protein